MREKIESICEVEVERSPENKFNNRHVGFKITTDKQEIFLLIEDCRQCCERYGYLLTEDQPDEFIGSTLRKIKITDTDRRVSSKCSTRDFVAKNCMFVDLITSIGVLQFVAYNEHNGYYGHDVRIISDQVTYKARL